MTWTHDGLAADLMDARHRAGEIALERVQVRGGILDVAAMRLSWTRPVITGYEVKISRADFLKDTRADKWRAYLPATQRLYFCFPRELAIDLREVPPECGVLLRGANGWYSRRTAPQRAIEPLAHSQFVQSLLFRHYPAPWQPAARGLLTLPTGRHVSAKDIQAGEVRTLYGKTMPLDAPLEVWERR